MKVGKLSALLLAVLVFSTLAFAQGSGSTREPTPSPGGTSTASRSYSVTQLSLTDFEPGQTIKVKYRADNGQVTEVRLKKDKVVEKAATDT
jgi:hypothetical protein